MAGRFRLSGTPQDPHATLEIRGISRGGTNERRYPQGGITSLFPSGHNFSPNSSDDDDESTIKDDSSDHYSPRITIGEDDLSNSESSRYWYGANSSTTGNTTERSSIYSWGDDVLDHKTSRDVQEMFHAIERMLFESVLSGSSLLQKECREWMDVFPHLRVKGKQALPTKDEGYQCFLSDTDSSFLSTPITDNPANELDTAISLTGSAITPIPPRDDNPGQSTSSHLHEEIFESDGEIEEYLAFDLRDMDEEDTFKRYHVPRRRRLGYPPITPNACVRDAVINQLFDNTWVKLISSLRKVKFRNDAAKKTSKSFWKVLFDNYSSICGRIEILRNFAEEPFDSDDQMNSHFNFYDDRLLMSRSDNFPPSREFSDQGARQSRLFGRFQQKNDFASLNSLMMIRRKELLVRSDRPNGTMPNESNMEISTPSVAFPRGSGSRLQLPGTASPQTYNQFIPLTMSRQTSAKQRGRGKQFHPSKLHPLIDRSKTPSVTLHKDWTIKGRNMPLSSLGLSQLDDHPDVVGIHVTSPASPPPTAPAIPGGSLYHTKVLPPLQLQSLNENSSVEFGRIQRRSNRISSAAPVDNKNQARVFFDGALRPNTTHAFRNDGKFRALSTTPSNFSTRAFGGRGVPPVKSSSPTGFNPSTAGNFMFSHSPDSHARGLAGIHGIGMMGHSGGHASHEQDDDRLGWSNSMRRRQVIGN